MFSNPMGGTELMYHELISRLPKNYLDEFSIFNYPSDADFNKKLVYWNQLSYDQEIVQYLKYPQNVNRIDYFVFVSFWQAEQFRKIFQIPGEKIRVIKNAHSNCSKKVLTPLTKSKLKLCYTSTPWRGLDVLLRAWEILNPQDCELHVFSSCKIYGKDFASEDSKYEFLYDWCKKLPNVVYRGSIPNSELRKELVEFDILAYPNTFEETSCISVIEALATGLRVVTSSLGALPETTEGFSRMYQYVDNREKHAQLFAKVLGEEVIKLRSGELYNNLKKQQDIYNERWSWNSRIDDWMNFLNESFGFRNAWDKFIFNEVYNKNEYEISTLDKNDIVLDIGSHIGGFTKLAMDKGSENVFSFEANPDNCKELRNKLSGYPVRLTEGAVFRSDIDIKTIKLKLDNLENYSSGNSMTLNVPVVKLDDVLSKFDKVKLMKIDVEGAEFPILLTSKLLGKVENIIGEFHEIDDMEKLNPDSIIKGYNGYFRSDLKSYLESYGFTVEMKEAKWSNKHGQFSAKK